MSNEHKQGCDALGGYGHGVGPCSCGAASTMLDDLQRKAEAAEMMPWEKSPADVPWSARHEFKEAISAELVLRLIAVARAAKAVGYSNGFDAAYPDKLAALRESLAALEGLGNQEGKDKISSTKGGRHG